MQVLEPPQNLGKCFLGSFKALENFKDDLGRSISQKAEFYLKTHVFSDKPTRDLQNPTVAGLVGAWWGVMQVSDPPQNLGKCFVGSFKLKL